MKLVILTAIAVASSACAETTAAPTHPAFIFITATPSPAASGTATVEVLPFRDLTSPTATETATQPSPTTTPATARAVDTRTPVIRPAAVTAPTAAPAPITPVAPTEQPAANPPTAAPVVQPVPVQPVSDVGSAEQAVIALTNLYRSQNSLAPLTRDEALMNVARSRSNDMVARGYFGHADPVTGQPLARPLILGLGYGRAGENIFWSGKGLADFPASAVNWFMGDAPHRANILNPAFTVIGIGLTYNGQGWTLAQDFAGP
jgi:uncharacterized protein YkwD